MIALFPQEDQIELTFSLDENCPVEAMFSARENDEVNLPHFAGQSAT